MSNLEHFNLEHLIENGLCYLSEGKSYRDWRGLMQEDCNWEGNENITIDNLWDICQYVIFTWDSERIFVRCKDCKYWNAGTCLNDRVSRQIEDCGCYPDFVTDSNWFCAEGERK